MIRNFLLIILLIFPVLSFSQETNTTPADQGLYWENGMQARWAPFGVFYKTRLYYRFALHRENKTFWFENSALELGIEQNISSFSQTFAYLFWQPVIAFNMAFRVGYSKDFVKPAALNGSNDDYSHAYPPFSGLNPMNRSPQRIDGVDTLEVHFSPTWSFGGSIKDHGAMALIYTPNFMYIHNFGMKQNQYYFNNKEAVVLKAQDIFWRHDIKLGYVIKHTGISVAATVLIEHVQSISGIFRAGAFASFSYEKPIASRPNFIPFFRGQVGSWFIDKHMKGDFAIQLDTGIKYKF